MTFDGTINLPNLVGFAVLLATLVAAFVRLEERQKAQAQLFERHETQDEERHTEAKGVFKELGTRCQELSERLARLEVHPKARSSRAD